ncbi:hypothetical protein [Spongiactinospora rosea]|uniref:hypothetical protein n=1 Tax=Spongiactinospora rosea TaxID=2248750 RepID=UPI00131479A2|nr:hypothetical protein [Spongiactinospora rosea]
MTGRADGIRYALIVPSARLWRAERVLAPARHLLGIELYTVDDDGHIELVPNPVTD